ncbi:hypothetical protein AC244_30500 [Ensifer adhaerens]|uniref:DUF2778 domain-containing protein n=1 Tax=Ensifer adhaerens TaxID=106592 RepID=A0A0L8BG70_ENSAD|nr:L,D-transpeptidase [Ensifer adhaerens]KOF13573.1 hypothetical protein AC244_30500 [Ensifer adhaerens]
MDQRNNGNRIKLHFDGKRLNATENGRYAGGWDGVSGRPGHQTPEWQGDAGEGPIPQGTYDVGPLQHIGLRDEALGMLKAVGVSKGGWPGGRYAWGRSRTWLDPKADIDPSGAHRSGFSIHGGSAPGSAGCIDLTGQMDNFADFYKKTGQSADLNVSYPEYDPETSASEAPERKHKPAPEPEGEYRWEPGISSPNRRGLSLRDALRIFE